MRQRRLTRWVVVLALLSSMLAPLPSAAQSTGSILGTVTTSGGTPASGVEVRAQQIGTGAVGFATTDGLGRYEVHHLSEGSYRLLFTAPESSGLASEVFDDAPTIGEATAVAVTPGGTTSGVDAVLTETGSIAGTVLPPPGSAAHIVVQVDGRGYFSSGIVVVDENGAYRVDGLPPDDYLVLFHVGPGPVRGEYFDDQWMAGTASLVTVTPGHVASADATLRECAAPASVDGLTLQNGFCLALDWLLESELATGVLGQPLRARDVVTRGDALSLLHRLEGSPPATSIDAGCVFIDVCADDPIFAAAAWMAEAGITGGYLDGSLRPDAPLTRQALVGFLHRLYGSEWQWGALDPAPCAFMDVCGDHPFSKPIYWGSIQGIATGYGDLTYRPGRGVTLQALAACMFRFESMRQRRAFFGEADSQPTP